MGRCGHEKVLFPLRWEDGGSGKMQLQVSFQMDSQWNHPLDELQKQWSKGNYSSYYLRT